MIKLKPIKEPTTGQTCWVEAEVSGQKLMIIAEIQKVHNTHIEVTAIASDQTILMVTEVYSREFLI